MGSEKAKGEWLEQSQQLLRAACTPWGIKAALVNKDNYGAIFTRDAVMAGIIGILLKDKVIIEGLKNTLYQLKELQGKQGQIASNFTVSEGKVIKVSFGTLSPKIDACTWYLIGIGLLIKEGMLDKEAYRESVEQTIDLLAALEYNESHLIYIPKGGNWADEYIYEGYVLYDQVLRAWALSLLAPSYENKDWSDKSAAILACLEKYYKDDKSQFFHSSFYPGGVFKKFDLAAHALAGIILDSNNSFFEQALDGIFKKFIEKGNLPPVFHPVINATDAEWATLRNYHLFAFKNKPHHYHNGGIWWIWLGWLSVAFSLWKKEKAQKKLVEIAFNYLDNLEAFDFEEYVSADKLFPDGTKKLCYTAAGIALLSLSKDAFDFSYLKASTMPLINELILLKSEYFALTSALIKGLENLSLLQKDKLVIAVCGESGSGKSVTAKCLQIGLEKLNIPSIILHQDSYYKLPPKENHEKRKADLTWVGSNEVQLDLMQAHIEQFKSHNPQITVPVVDYKKNIFFQQNTPIKDKAVLIVEGVYAFLLNHLDYKIFIKKNYKDTLEKRKERNREVYDPFVEQVLAIEHSLVMPLKELADVVVGKDYSIG